MSYRRRPHLLSTSDCYRTLIEHARFIIRWRSQTVGNQNPGISTCSNTFLHKMKHQRWQCNAPKDEEQGRWSNVFCAGRVRLRRDTYLVPTPRCHPTITSWSATRFSPQELLETSGCSYLKLTGNLTKHFFYAFNCDSSFLCILYHERRNSFMSATLGRHSLEPCISVTSILSPNTLVRRDAEGQISLRVRGLILANVVLLLLRQHNMH